MPERNRNVWAPWRMEYIEALDDSSEADVCFLCEYAAHGEQDAANHVLLRSEHTLVLLNRFPYTNGHLLISPVAHVADPVEIPASVWAELADRYKTQSLRDLAKEYGVSHETVRRVLHR